uniref:Uncharacterized protein n=1 Tax=Megaselia scalaris TaxID=36166 RepID=T1H5A7_MEGSC
LRRNSKQHPYQVSLEKYGSHNCGASLYRTNIVVTAAHCLQGNINGKHLNVRAESTDKTRGEQVIQVKSYINHPDCNSSTFSNVSFTRKIRLLAQCVSYSKGKKMDAKAEKGYLVGYNGVESYRIYVPELRCVVERCLFHENIQDCQEYLPECNQEDDLASLPILQS